MTFTIDRATWANPSTTKRSKMLDPENGLMCCLGQICKQTGTPKKHLAEWDTPVDVGDDIRSARVRALLLNEDGESSELAIAAMGLNDNPYMGERTRERDLKALFREFGHKLTFVGRSPRR